MSTIFLIIIIIISISINVILYANYYFYSERFNLLCDLNEIEKIMNYEDLTFRDACHYKNWSKYHRSEKDYDDCENFFIERAKKFNLMHKINNLKK